VFMKPPGVVRPTAMMAMTPSPGTAHGVSNSRYKTIGKVQDRYARPHSLHGTSLTIPGCSPSHSIIDSPVLLPSYQAELSPTTGTFPLAPGFRSGGVISVGTGAAQNRQDQARMSPLGPLAVSNKPATAEEPQQSAKPASTEKHRSDDGYNWRKYGQKQVRGCERSYFKCTRPNCNAKKKVERSESGRIVERLCQEHNHPPPHGAGGRKSLGPDDSPGETDGNVRKRGRKSTSGQETAANTRRMSKDNAASEDDEDDVDEPSSSLSEDMPEAVLEPIEEVASRRYSRGRSSFGSDGGIGSEEPTPNTKRRRLFPPASDMTSPEPLRPLEPDSDGTRATPEPATATPPVQQGGRESRLVVLTAAELETLDDGYRWRKYGQKLVKGNPHPRSYYKCTHAGCAVRKHVERSSTDESSVLVTYEGSHGHERPAVSAKQGKRASTGGAAAASNDSEPADAKPSASGRRSSSGGRDDNRRTSQRVGRAPVSLEVVVPSDERPDYGPMSILDSAKINKEADGAADSALKTLDFPMPELGPPTQRGLPSLQTDLPHHPGPGSLAAPTPTPKNPADPMGFLTTPKTPAVNSELKG